MSDNAIERERPRTFDAVPASARAARQYVVELLRGHGAVEETIGDYALVVSELVTNVIEHGGGSGVAIVLDSTDPEWWQVDVIGGTPSLSALVLDPQSWKVAGADALSGRGLGIVHQLMDDVTTHMIDGQLSVCCRRRRSEPLSS